MIWVWGNQSFTLNLLVGKAVHERKDGCLIITIFNAKNLCGVFAKLFIILQMTQTLTRMMVNELYLSTWNVHNDRNQNQQSMQYIKIFNEEQC